MASNGLGFQVVLREGGIIAGILAFWGVFAVVGIGIGNVGFQGNMVGDALAGLFVAVGLGNALLYILARGIALSDRD